MKKHKKILTILCFCLGALSFVGVLLSVGGAGVLSDLESALVEIKDLEQKGLLSNPPKTISPIAKREIKLLHNSKALESYIQEVEASNQTLSNWTLIFLCLFVFMMVLRRFKR